MFSKTDRFRGFPDKQTLFIPAYQVICFICPSLNPNSHAMVIQAFLADIHSRRIYPAEVRFENGRITGTSELESVAPDAGYLIPGFTDAHVHVESSMLPPSEFARLAVVHGTVATVSDPHEIANVLGMEGVDFMLRDAARVPLKYCFGAPSCVPATSFETAGATLDAADVARLLENPDIGYLSEMMNFPGVLHNDPEVMKKIGAAHKTGKPVDGHAPGLTGDDARRYFGTGISTDHECFTYQEGREKALLGVKILIREGSAARNFDALWPLLNEFPEQVMFCSDDKHPDDLIAGHINLLVARAVANGCNLFDTLRAACLHPVAHYNLNVGLLRTGDPADFVLLEDLSYLKPRQTWINGELVAENGVSLLPRLSVDTPNNFHATTVRATDFEMKCTPGQQARIIRVLDGEIVTESETGAVPCSADGFALADPDSDTIFITVVNRYTPGARPAVALVRGTGIAEGALASSVAHDSHNIVAIGNSPGNLARAVNAVIEAGGGISATNGNETRMLPLPIAGLMSDADGYELAKNYAGLDKWVKTALGCQLRAPFMSLSFLALPVIPKLKITDRGLFDVEQFRFA
jgi:adenine deaminase